MTPADRSRRQTYDCRKAFAEELIALAREDDRIVAVCNDSVGSSNLVAFREEFPDRLINVGIAEQDLVGVGAGLANGGLIPFVCAAAPFLTGRALEQIKADVAYSNVHVVLCGQSPGMAYGELGPTHHSIEDLSWLRAVADLPVVVPADPAQTRAAVRWAADGRAARATCASPRSRCPTVTPDDAPFEPGRSRPPRRGRRRHGDRRRDDGVARAATPRDELRKRRHRACACSTWRSSSPLDDDAVVAAARETGAIVTAEEATVSGGLGAAVASLVVRAPSRADAHPRHPRRVRADRQRRRSCSTTSGSPPTASPPRHGELLRPCRAADAAGPRDRPGHELDEGAARRPRPARSSRRAGAPLVAEPSAARVGRAVGDRDLASVQGGRRRVRRGRGPAPTSSASGSAPSASRCCCGTARSGRPLGPLLSAGRTSAPPAAARGCAPTGVGELVRDRERAAARPDVLGAQGALAARRVRPRTARRAARGELCLGTVDSWLLSRVRRRAPDRGRQRVADPAARRARRGPGTSELLDLFGVPPRCSRGWSRRRARSPAVRDLPPLPDGTPVGAVMGDSHAALFAHAGWRPGRVKATYGTGSSVMGLAEPSAEAPARVCLTIAWDDGQPRYALEGNIRSSGATLVWLAELVGATPDELAGRGGAATATASTSCPRSAGWARRGGTTTPSGMISGLTLGSRRAAARARGAGVDRLPGRGRRRRRRAATSDGSRRCSPTVGRPPTPC